MQEKIKQLEGSVANLAANTSPSKTSSGQMQTSESAIPQTSSDNDV